MQPRLRPFEDDDEDAVLRLLARSLGKEEGDRYRAFFRWKHHENPFGRSYMWVAEVDGAIAGFRAFMRWRFATGDGGVLDAVRAVDTVTDPDHRGAGIFTKLTMHGIGGLRDAGVDLIFNTPNSQSLPGYLKMGWRELGRLPVRVALRSLACGPRVARARKAAAAPWSLPTDVGSAPHVTDHTVEAIRAGGDDRVRTAWTVPTLQWRLGGFEPTAYRTLAADGQGWVAVRFRERGPAIECSVGPAWGDGAGAARAVAAAMREVRATHAMAIVGSPAVPHRRALNAPVGPVLVARGVCATELPPLERWRLDMADVELF